MGKPLTLSLLHSYYPVVHSMHEYLALVIKSEDGREIDFTHETDTLNYRRLLKECRVAAQPEVLRKELLVNPAMDSLREVLERAQHRLLTKASTRNILTSGYSIARNGDAIRGAGRACLVNYYVNTMVTVFQAEEWSTLYDRIGTDVMFHLLTETSMFISLPNGCLCQLTGEPLINLKLPEVLADAPSPVGLQRVRPLKRKRCDSLSDERLVKRLKKCDSSSSAATSSLAPVLPRAKQRIVEKRTPADTHIVRRKLFYGRPHCSSRTGKIIFGLPVKHVLNQFEMHATDVRKQFEQARHLAKYVFPRQYGLTNPFSVVKETQFSAAEQDWTNREAEIKALGPCKTPKRLRQALSLLEKLIWYHGKCGYKPLLQKLCPSKIKASNLELSDDSIILELMSESTVPPLTQLKVPSSSLYSDGPSIVQPGGVKQKPRFAEFMCSYAEVFRFAVVVTKAVIPTAFWGSKRNFKLVTKQIRSFIALRKYESLSLHSLLQGFRTSDCEWLMPDTLGAQKQARVSVTDSLKRTELLQEFLFWYFDGFLLPLLKANFYITESGAFRNRVLYFRHDDWDTLCKPLVERLSADTFQKLSQHDAEEILRQRKLGFSFVRLLPKETGVRPIVNLRQKKIRTQTGKGAYVQSINQILKAAFLILTYEKEAQSKLTGASVFGPNEIYTKLKGFKTKLLKDSPNGLKPKLYFVKVDVCACFDTIDQRKLLEILREVISEKEYLIQRHGQANVTTGQIRRHFVKKAMPADDHPHFFLYASKLAEALRHTIFVDQVTYPSAKRDEIMQLLEQHITDNIVKIGNDYYKQVVGIPQGSVLSSLLCSYFYGDLERRRLQFTQDPNCVLLRLIDDYLFVTTDYRQAKRFLDVMEQGHPEYGCFVSKEKTLTNFNDTAFGNILDPESKVFPWCGFRIDMADLSVSVDYSRFYDTYLQDSLTVDRGRQPGSRFTQKMLQLAKSRSHIIYTDLKLNSAKVVHKNIYENFLLTAMKMHHYVRSWGIDPKNSSQLIINTIRQIVHYTYATIRNKARTKVARASRGQRCIPRNVVSWLGTHAYHAVLSRKSHGYAAVLKSLERDLHAVQHRSLRRRFSGVVKEGEELFTLLCF